MTDPIQQLRTAMAARNIIPPDDLIPDGRIHRCDTEGKNGKGDAAYLLHIDGIPAGGFENHRDGLGWENWRADTGRILSPSEEAAYRKSIAAARHEREIDEANRRQQAQHAAQKLWQAASPCTNHPYLAAKSIDAHGLRQQGDVLLIPMRDDSGTLHSLQTIEAGGKKRFLASGRTAGCYFGIGKPDGVLCIVEGFATGASVHEATGHAVAVAFTAGNLLTVAQAMRVKFPSMTIILCADDDNATPGNPGLTRAIIAARSIDGLLAVPEFGDKRLLGDTDFNDLHHRQGLEAVRRDIGAAKPAPDTEPSAAGKNATAGKDTPSRDYARSVELIRASDVKPEAIAWIWKGWLAEGKLHVLGGAPGTGKTTISMALAATVTTGGIWPDGSKAPVGNVVIWSGEDDPKDTLTPRLLLSGADTCRVYFISGVQQGGEHHTFDPSRDMEPLRQKLAEIGNVRLLIVDPIVSAIAGDSHKNAEVRRGLQPLVDLAASMRCALLGVTHFSKGTGGREPVERLTGSLAFGALARVVLVAAKQQEEGQDGRTVRLLCRAKSNIGPDAGGFEYDLHQSELKTHPGIFASSVLWGNAVDGTARELLAEADATDDDGDGRTLSEAKKFLIDLLTDGPLRAGEIFKDADQAGHTKRSIQRAASALKVDKRKDGMKGGWFWRLPPKVPNSPEGAKQNYLAPSTPSVAPSIVEIEI